MSRRNLQIFAAVVSASTLLFTVGCTSTLPTQVTWQEDGPPIHKHPTQSWWKHHYVYYPKLQVYYEPFSKTYYWFEHDLWFSGDELPKAMILHGADAVAVKLTEEPPFAQHETVISRAGPPMGRFPGSHSPGYAPNAAFKKSVLEAKRIMAMKRQWRANVGFVPQRRVRPNRAEHRLVTSVDPTTTGNRHLLRHAGNTMSNTPATARAFTYDTQLQFTDNPIMRSPIVSHSTSIEDWTTQAIDETTDQTTFAETEQQDDQSFDDSTEFQQAEADEPMEEEMTEDETDTIATAEPDTPQD